MQFLHHERKKEEASDKYLHLAPGFASLVSTLSTKYPTIVPEFLAYPSICFKDIEGLG